MKMSVLSVLSVLSVSAAHAHEWYPPVCCSNRDCYEISQDDFELTDDGYYIHASGETIPYDQVRRTPAEGGATFHRCSTSGDPAGVTIGMRSIQQACFWAPPMSF